MKPPTSALTPEELAALQYFQAAAERATAGARQASKMEALREIFDQLGDIHLAACSAGAVSPLHSMPVPAADVSPDEKQLGQGPAGAHITSLAGVHIMQGAGPAGIKVLSGELPETEFDAPADHIGETFARDSAFVYLVKNRTGELISPEADRKRREERAKLDAQSMEIALALEHAAARRRATDPDFAQAHPRFGGFDKAQAKRLPVIVDPVRKIALPVAPVRRINFIPSAASARRSPMLKHLEHLLTVLRFVRMLTLTNGQRVSLSTPGAIREAIGRFHRKVSKFAAWLRKEYGAIMHFRATEFGTLLRACPWPRQESPKAADLFGAPDEDPGEILVHIHAHVFVTFRDKMGSEGWRDFLRAAWRRWGHHWDAGRTIADAREACKYPVKPGDLEAARMTADELLRLWEEIRGMRLVTPMGALKPKIRERRARALKGCKHRHSNGDLSLVWVSDWNAHGPRDLEAQAKKAKAARELLMRSRARFIAAALLMDAARACLAGIPAPNEERRALACTCMEMARFWALDAPPNEAEQIRASKARARAIAAARPKPPPRENQIVTRMAPAPYFDNMTTPALLVWRFTGDWSALQSQPVCKQIIEAAGPLIAAAQQEQARDRRQAAREAGAPLLLVSTPCTQLSPVLTPAT